MGKKGFLAVLACVFAVSLMLAGCGGTSKEDAKKAFVGTWDLIEMSNGDQVTGSEDLETLKALGLEVYLNLDEDGTAAFVLFGEAIMGTWDAKSTTEGSMSITDTDTGTEMNCTMTISDSTLVFEQDGTSMKFKKGEPKESPSTSLNGESASSSEASSAASSESASAGGESASEGSASASASSESASSSGASASAGSASSSAN